MNYLAKPTSREKGRSLFRLAILLAVGIAAGIATSSLTYHLMKGNRGADDVAYALGGGAASLFTGIVLIFWSLKDPAWWLSLTVSLLLGLGITFVALGFFWWLERSVFVYSQHPDLNYFLGEVSGYSGPGLGLLTCGIVLLVSAGGWLDKSQRSLSPEVYPNPLLKVVSSPRHPMLEILLYLLVASIGGAGGGLLSGAIIYILLLGKAGATSTLAGFVASGSGCLFAGVAFVLICAKRERMYWWCWVIVALLLLAGITLWGTGVFQWLTLPRGHSARGLL